MPATAAILLADTNAYATVTNYAALDFSGTTMTIEWWYRWNSYGTNRGNFKHNSNLNTGWYINTRGNGDFSLTTADGTTQSIGPFAGAGYFDNNWHHVALTKDSDGMHQYVDGVEWGFNTNGIGATIAASGADLILGHGSLPLPGIPGYYSDIRVWNIARSASDIAT